MSESPATIVQMPGGFELPVPEGQTVEHAYWRHCYTSVTEGLCPHCQASLDPVPATDGRIGAYCPRCVHYWYADPGTQVTGWDLGYNPHTGEPMVPGWAAPETAERRDPP